MVLPSTQLSCALKLCNLTPLSLKLKKFQIHFPHGEKNVT